jgi:hypothetical protein
MWNWKHSFLALSLIALAVGLGVSRSGIIFDLSLPVGAILFGLFLITQVLEQEMALYDEQTRTSELALAPGLLRAQPLSIRQEVAHDPAHTMA